ncbi:CTSB [Acanthosepion pharaonis]|uniref:CTSB n=1 Tax=Acanthosepion pharaonis TaxID=158019 RepID=A0A812BSE3_ACAPH|nr:CTSB [Sepia pharaonis]
MSELYDGYNDFKFHLKHTQFCLVFQRLMSIMGATLISLVVATLFVSLTLSASVVQMNMETPMASMVRRINSLKTTWEATAAVEAMSDRICIASKGTKNAHLSIEDLLTCCNECGEGCNGGYPEYAWYYFKERGIVTGGPYHSHKGCQPYKIPACDHHVVGPLAPCKGDLPTPRCSSRCEYGYNNTYHDDKHFGFFKIKRGSNECGIEDSPVAGIPSV